MSARNCEWCRCSIADKRPNAQTCDAACRKAKSRGQRPPRTCHCGAPLAPGRDRSHRFVCGDECLHTVEPIGRTRAVRADRYLTDKPRLHALRCACEPKPASSIDDNGFTVCSTCEKRRDDRRRHVEPEPAWIAQVAGPLGVRMVPYDDDAAPLYEMPGLTTRTVNGRHKQLPKEIRQCAACGAVLTFRKRGVRCHACDEAELSEAS